LIRGAEAAALDVAGEFACSADCIAGGVASALLTASGDIFTGICIGTASRRRQMLSSGGELAPDGASILRHPPSAPESCDDVPNLVADARCGI